MSETDISQPGQIKAKWLMYLRKSTNPFSIGPMPSSHLLSLASGMSVCRSVRHFDP